MSGVAEGADEAAQRSQGYWLLSRLFLEVPTPAGLAELRDLLRNSAADAALLNAGVEDALADPDAAAVAFTRYLCIGDRGHSEPLPFESHVREGSLPGENTLHVAALMAGAGYEDVAPGAVSPDHLGAELRFMAFLCHAEHRARQDRDGAEVHAKLQLQQSFLHSHLGQWAPAYCSGLAGRAVNAYVRAIAAVTASTISGEIALIDELCRRAAAQQVAPVLAA